MTDYLICCQRDLLYVTKDLRYWAGVYCDELQKEDPKYYKGMYAVLHAVYPTDDLWCGPYSCIAEVESSIGGGCYSRADRMQRFKNALVSEGVQDRIRELSSRGFNKLCEVVGAKDMVARLHRIRKA